MAVHIPGGYGQLTIEHWLTGYTRPACNVWGFHVDEIPEGGLPSLPDLMLARYSAAFRALIDSDVRVRNPRVVVGTLDGEPLVYVGTSEFSGTATRASVPPALALMVNLNTATGGRAGRGRKYFPWMVAENQVDEMGSIASAPLTALQTALNLWGADNAAEGTPLMLLHSGARMPSPILSMTPNPVIRTQKQRQARF